MFNEDDYSRIRTPCDDEEEGTSGMEDIDDTDDIDLMQLDELDIDSLADDEDEGN
jgi:hypothetical protein